MKQRKQYKRGELIKALEQMLKNWFDAGHGELGRHVVKDGNTIRLTIGSRSLRKKFIPGVGMTNDIPMLNEIQKSEIVMFIQKLKKHFELTLEAMLVKARQVICTFVLPTAPSPS